ncbi:mitochondrial import inner membrane translocase, subunit Tim17/22 [Annulohypoxylon maeteangense]|uniref:mitochondrial import inner membrane translocase, subunit Tim17/22 n=1 Tax=Annulohypoxylon maeteangense TaxID=1927788 RepID=UPI0020076321|nr:mitochondrial import inner membrane translocase, subunit Tim17/22 [Annulohypoxylon maeteangense]KAI0884404.1 mitochondrial import inner membrane translocase, subunit Tim17/22 [Annulohypoxylon maeteangense]
MNGIPGAGAGAPAAQGQYDPNDPNIKRLNAMMESCFGKAAVSGVMGFGMGGLFGMFMASMSYDTPFHTPGAPGSATPVSSLPLRQQLKVGFKDMGTRSYSTAKNFGLVGLMFAGIECGIEGYRAKNDLVNGTAAGCLTGGILARSGGPTAVAGGCAAFAAFSAAIDVWLRQPKDDE